MDGSLLADGGLGVAHGLDHIRVENADPSEDRLRFRRFTGFTGEHPGEYLLLDVQTYRPFSYKLILRRRITTP